METPSLPLPPRLLLFATQSIIINRAFDGPRGGQQWRQISSRLSADYYNDLLPLHFTTRSLWHTFSNPSSSILSGREVSIIIPVAQSCIVAIPVIAPLSDSLHIWPNKEDNKWTNKIFTRPPKSSSSTITIKRHYLLYWRRMPLRMDVFTRMHTTFTPACPPPQILFFRILLAEHHSLLSLPAKDLTAANWITIILPPSPSSAPFIRRTVALTNGLLYCVRETGSPKSDLHKPLATYKSHSSSRQKKGLDSALSMFMYFCWRTVSLS